MIQVGTGGIGSRWCRTFLPPFVASGDLEVVAAVDINAEALVNAREGLGLSQSQCYTDIEAAFSEHPADFCTVVVPPGHHESVVDAALGHDLHILSEKPIADTFIASCRIAEKVARAGKKMAVTMSHRFDQDKTTLRQAVRDPSSGEVDYVIGRFHDDCRKWLAWGAEFRHTIPDPLLIEGAVHHLDILVDLAGARCDRVYAETWNPRWGAYAGDSQALITLHFENGRRAFYEGALTNAVKLNGWSQEYFRAECERATLVLSQRRVERFTYDQTATHTLGTEGRGEEVPLLERPYWSHQWLVEQFIAWLNGGPAMETAVDRNLESLAIVFGAIQSSRTGQPVAVQEYLAEVRGTLA
jgi:predicted dehydrogenase